MPTSPLLDQAMTLHRAGALDRAEAIYRDVLAAAPDHAEALHMLGVLEVQRGRAGEGAALIRRAIAADADLPAAHANLAAALLDLGEFSAALEASARAIALRPGDLEARYNHATALMRLGRRSEALAAFDEVLARRPAHVAALIARGAARRDDGAPDLALHDFDAAAGYAPSSVLAHYNRGAALKDLNRIAEAEEALRRALALSPDFAEAHLALAECLFLKGEAAAAWGEYEWRWRTAGLAPLARQFPQPRWTGREDPAGRTMLIHAEQGFGDVVQFARYVPLAAARAVRVLLQVPATLKPLMSSLPGAAQVLGDDEVLPAFDLQCPLMSLPLAVGAAAPSAPYLTAQSDKIAQWRARLGPVQRRVGLAWSGSTTHANDRNRSLPLQMLTPLLTADAAFISLQKDVRPSDRAALAQSRVFDPAEHLADFADTAALITALDLVISVDTVTAHLAGALGKPVWILLPHAPDWRWGLNGETTPWYPTARLYRQPARGEWAGVIARLAADMKAFTP